MNTYVRLDFENEKDIVKYDFVNITKENDVVMVNFYKYRDFTRCKTEIRENLLKATTLIDTLKSFKELGFYLYLVEKIEPNINYFIIVRNLDKNKINYPNNFTNKYIENHCYNKQDNKSKLDLSDLD